MDNVGGAAPKDVLRLDKVLHVENERIHRMLMRVWFPDWGWYEADTLEEGIEIIQREQNNFQLIVLDLNLDDSRGIATVERYHACSVAPIVVSTADAPSVEELQARAHELGVYGIIEKGKSFTSSRVRPILLNAYRDWRDPRLVMDLQVLNAATEKATAQRTKWLEDRAKGK